MGMVPDLVQLYFSFLLLLRCITVYMMLLCWTIFFFAVLAVLV